MSSLYNGQNVSEGFNCQCRDKTPAILPILPIRAAVNLGGDAVGTLQQFLHLSFSYGVVCFAQKLESLSISEETH